MTTTMSKAPTLKQAKKACLQLHSLIVRANNDGCQANGILPHECVGHMQCAHIIPKKGNAFASLHEWNGWSLCQAHHRYIDNSANIGRWLHLVNKTCGTELINYLLRIHDKRLEDHGPGSRLKWYRSELVRLAWACDSYGIPIRPLPLHIKVWLESQPENADY